MKKPDDEDGGTSLPTLTILIKAIVDERTSTVQILGQMGTVPRGRWSLEWQIQTLGAEKPPVAFDGHGIKVHVSDPRISVGPVNPGRNPDTQRRALVDNPTDRYFTTGRYTVTVVVVRDGFSLASVREDPTVIFSPDPAQFLI